MHRLPRHIELEWYRKGLLGDNYLREFYPKARPFGEAVIQTAASEYPFGPSEREIVPIRPRTRCCDGNHRMNPVR